MNGNFNDNGKVFYPYGVQYYRAPTPLPEEWEDDLREIARCGYTHIQLRPQWRWHEQERGQAVWDDLDRLFDLAAENGLRAVLKPMLETAPDWVFQELGGTRIGFHGVPISPFAHGAYYVGGWWPCFDNPLVVEAAVDFVQRMVERYRAHPALWFYDAWNEPVSRPLGQCQCPHSVASYRNWLKERFHSIKTLNAFLGKAWTSFETLFPPSAADDYAEMYLWRQWAAFSVSKQVQFVAETVRRCHAGAMVMVHAGGSAVVQDPAWATTDDMLNSLHVDKYGTSFFIPLHPATPVEHAAPDYQSDWIRRIDPAYWCHEFYTNHAEWCRPPDPVVLNRLIWMAVSGGAAGFTFWQYRSERVGCETNGFGLREIDGSATERSRVADGIAAILKKHGERLVGTQRPSSGVGLMYNRRTDLMSRIQSMQSWTAGIEREGPDIDYPYKSRLKAAHALYLHAGETVDWVVPGDDLSGKRILHLTGEEMIDADTAQWLRDYVHGGGRLIVEFPFACRDDNTWVSKVRPNHGLVDLTGCKEAFRVVNDQGHAAQFDNGLSVIPADWRIDLAPQGDVEVIGRWSDGTPAALKHHLGDGVVYVFGAGFTGSFNDSFNSSAGDMTAWLLREAGIVPESRDGIWVRRRLGADREIRFVFNMSSMSQVIPLPAKPRDVWQGSGSRLNDLELTLETGRTWVAELPVVSTGR